VLLFRQSHSWARPVECDEAEVEGDVGPFENFRSLRASLMSLRVIRRHRFVDLVSPCPEPSIDRVDPSVQRRELWVERMVLKKDLTAFGLEPSELPDAVGKIFDLSAFAGVDALGAYALIFELAGKRNVDGPVRLECHRP
jgi:hypothetical protein